MAGGSAVTSAGNMPCKHVIHTVGPRYKDYGPTQARAILQTAIINTLEAAKKIKA